MLLSYSTTHGVLESIDPWEPLPSPKQFWNRAHSITFAWFPGPSKLSNQHRLVNSDDELHYPTNDAKFLRISIEVAQKISEDMMWNIVINDAGAAENPLTRTLYGRPDWMSIHDRLRWAIKSGEYLPGSPHSFRLKSDVFMQTGADRRDIKVATRHHSGPAVDLSLAKVGALLAVAVRSGYLDAIFARIVFQNSVLPNFVNAIGYTTLAANATSIFSEFVNTGAGASTSKRVTYTPISAAITHAQVLGPLYSS
ncbi:hypothetical protein DFH09DRAFT_1380272 [Mycena vulgaris]|nr:hypothetical protein DFH09DRAFT_1380272 [Mycena vulgaris]